jgi:hypothetical protein
MQANSAPKGSGLRHGRLSGRSVPNSSVPERTALIGLAVGLAVIVARYGSNQPLENMARPGRGIPAVLVTATVDMELQDR